MTSNGISRSWRVGLAIDREGDADAAEQQLGLAPAVVEHVGRDFGEPARQLAIGGPQRPVGALHLVERDGRHELSRVARPLHLPQAGGATRS